MIGNSEFTEDTKLWLSPQVDVSTLIWSTSNLHCDLALQRESSVLTESVVPVCQLVPVCRRSRKLKRLEDVSQLPFIVITLLN